MPIFQQVSNTFPVWYSDGVFPRSVLSGLRAEWPKRSWDYWIRYSDHNSNKYASRCGLASLPPIAQSVLTQMSLFMLPGILELQDYFPDLSLHGSGLHELPEGGYLKEHLDCAQHPIKPWTRKLSMCYYIDSLDNFEGSICFRNNGEEVNLETKENRLVIFDSTDLRHGVSTTSKRRRSLSLFYWKEGLDSDRLDTSANFGVDNEV